MTSIASYRSAMLQRKAAAAGCTVAELLARSEAEAARTRAFNELRYDRKLQWRAIARWAMEHGRRWEVVGLAIRRAT